MGAQPAGKPRKALTRLDFLTHCRLGFVLRSLGFVAIDILSRLTLRSHHNIQARHFSLHASTFR